MSHGARRGKANCTSPHGLFNHRAHARQVVPSRVFVVATALAHHVITQGAVCELGADVEGILSRCKKVEIFGEGFPFAPGHAFVEGGARDVFDAFHQFDQLVFRTFMNRCEADTAVAHDDRRHTVRGRRIDLVVPSHLAVVVRVNVDPTRRHQRAVSIHHLLGVFTHLPRRHDATVANPDIAGLCRSTGSVHNVCALDFGIEHRDLRYVNESSDC